MTELEMNKEYSYPQICEIVGWEQKAGNSKKAQIKEIEDAYEYYHPENKKTHKPKKSYIFTRKIRDLVEPSKANSAGNNRKNIQSMIDYLQIKFDLDDNWYSFTDWYCKKLELMHKGICNAMYHEDEIDAVCEEFNITDEKLFFEYVSAAKSELKSMFLKSLGYLEKKDKITYYDDMKFIYQLGERTIGYVTTGCLNDQVKDIETIVCNDMNAEHNMSKKMKGRQLLKIIYNNKKYTEDFKELCLSALNDNDEVLEKLNIELSAQCPTFHPDLGTICSERPLINYSHGLYITDMELFEYDATKRRELGLEITNKIRTKVRRTLRKAYRKFMKESDLQAIEKALFQYYDERFVDEFVADISNDDAAELDEIFDNQNDFINDPDNWGEPVSIENDFSIEDILDMPVMGEESRNNFVTPKQSSIPSQIDDINVDESHVRKTDRELFYVTEKGSDYIDIDDLY